ncbi:dihydroorotate dehydrogenase electron transfer subunit [Paenibacillus caui]|uniref:dihydroorotate dehydrogenase electron transfer subunit n=1 Tax=Paenibacillus caui TaxID=2873927 RepID=UPI001CA953A0|nr:dihydroorotate dehydrogenase electron transfer subunit [Paenibacillus caui]
MTTASILDNTRISSDVYLMTVSTGKGGSPGQFYMLRQWNQSPLLSRPISIFDAQGDSVKFLYQIVGEGTKRLAGLRKGETIDIEGPFGNGFPQVSGRIAIVGGGIGIAPFYYALRTMPEADVYLGFSREPYLVDEFRKLTDNVTVDVGGYILDKVDFASYDKVLVCGPNPMMKAAQRKNEAAGGAGKVFVSLENRMACGIGACLVCSVKSGSSRKKACADGPVFAVEEVVFDD